MLKDIYKCALRGVVRSIMGTRLQVKKNKKTHIPPTPKTHQVWEKKAEHKTISEERNTVITQLALTAGTPGSNWGRGGGVMEEPLVKCYFQTGDQGRRIGWGICQLASESRS